jgi:hypothetical protein
MSDVTPKSRGGNGLPLNSRGNGAGACNYCHDDDTTADPIIRTTALLHHHTSDAIEGTLDCLVCHDVSDDSLDMRVCEGCHGPDSLHNIQADSPASDNLGTIVVGGELAGYGHVGRDAGPGDSDCWGCHGFEAASAPDIGPIIPTVYRTDPVFMNAGSNATLLLEGTSFVNTASAILYESAVELTGLDGTSLTLEPDIILDEGTLIVTIPGDTSAGNYRVRAVKDEFASNPAVISVVPPVSIDRVTTRRGRTTIYGTGFAGFAAGSGTEVYATYVKRVGRRSKTFSMTGDVLSWTEDQIVVSFPEFPRTITVQSVFGSDRYVLVSE